MCGSVVITVRVPKELKEIMDKYSGIINWSEEIRNFIIRRITEIRQEEALNRLNSIIEKLPELPTGSIMSLVREDRDSH
ncbi:hypothetical protein [Vulcanisaeta distributa]|uniref:type II toxin-antitoxin system VapB family antitoxin n=1 Tax=Vulcanisaeta distributa TaxID=164451 RepID=UPI0006D22E0A|nr:hypothetical protein [Vulcanisaeta distributa]